MLDKLKGIEERYEQLGKELLEIGSNYQRAGEINTQPYYPCRFKNR